MRRIRIPICGWVPLAAAFAAGTLEGMAQNPGIQPAAEAINSLAVRLLSKLGPAEDNALISPYSIQTALAMTFAGAAGETREEMARALGFGADEGALHRAFGALQGDLADIARSSEQRVTIAARWGQKADPLSINVANRLFGQRDFEFRPEFLQLVRDLYGAPLELCDFRRQAVQETRRINSWVARETRDRIRDLIPIGALNELTRLVLVNAIHLKAPWDKPFEKRDTRPAPFYVRGRERVDVPTMFQSQRLGYRHDDGFTAVTIPYVTGRLQMLVLLPDSMEGLPDLEQRLTADLLSSCARLPEQEVRLFLPKFRLEPPAVALKPVLKALGMRRAFDDPPGSADFDRMAPSRGADRLLVSEVFHKTFIEVDEEGTEAAAATAVLMVATAARLEPPKPVEVRVDRPFLFAIQHRESGACLFWGRVTDPR